jgi:hypothetical protein
MNRSLLIIAVLATLFLSTSPAHATLLILNSNSVVYDTATTQYWIADLNSFINLSYSGQIDKINNNYNNPSFFGINNWHLATLTDMIGLRNNPVADLSVAFAPPSPWAGRYDEMAPGVNNQHFSATLTSKLNDPYFIMPDGGYSSRLGAWVVGGPVPAPEPSAFLLIGASLGGLALWRRMKI